MGPRGRRSGCGSTRPHRTIVDGEPAPDRNDEYRFYQALIGAWPPSGADATAAATAEFVERLQGYMLKAVREAKIHTSWLTHERRSTKTALTDFVERVLRAAGAREVPAAFLPFQQRIAALGVRELAGAGRAQARVAGRAGLLPGHRAVGSQPRGSRQPAAGGLRAERSGCWTRRLGPASSGAERVRLCGAARRAGTDGRIKLLRHRRGPAPPARAAGRFRRRRLPAADVGNHRAAAAWSASRGCPADQRARRRPRRGSSRLCRLPACAAARRRPLEDVADHAARRHWRIGRSATCFTGADIRPATTGAESWIFVGQLFLDSR